MCEHITLHFLELEVKTMISTERTVTAGRLKHAGRYICITYRWTGIVGVTFRSFFSAIVYFKPIGWQEIQRQIWWEIRALYDRICPQVTYQIDINLVFENVYCIQFL